MEAERLFPASATIAPMSKRVFALLLLPAAGLTACDGLPVGTRGSRAPGSTIEATARPTAVRLPADPKLSAPPPSATEADDFEPPSAVYAARRARLLQRLGDGVAVVFGKKSIDDDERQDADFYYLTGIVDPGAALVLAPAAKPHREMLYLKNRDPEVERWDGPRPPLSLELKRRTGFERIRRTSRLPGALSSLADKHRRLVFLGPIVGHDSPVPRALSVLRKVTARVPGARIDNAADLLPRMRQIKGPQEIELIREATRATGAGHAAALMALKPGLSEWGLKDVIQRAFRDAGAKRLAFPSIVGSGPNSSVLHYRDDSRAMQEGEVVVIDIGAEVEQYASDITRTLPVGGRFSDRQREVYDLVLSAQEAAIAAIRPGIRVRDVDRTARDLIEAAGHHDDFIHGTSHFVGLSVHDAGRYGEPLLPGSVITVEPGVYLPHEGFGVRIEDVVLVTAEGHEVLSSGIPKAAEEIERAMAGRTAP